MIDAAIEAELDRQEDKKLRSKFEADRMEMVEKKINSLKMNEQTLEEAI